MGQWGKVNRMEEASAFGLDRPAPQILPRRESVEAPVPTKRDELATRRVRAAEDLGSQVVAGETQAGELTAAVDVESEAQQQLG